MTEPGLDLVANARAEVVVAACRMVDFWSRRPDRSVAYQEAKITAKNRLTRAVQNYREAVSR